MESLQSLTFIINPWSLNLPAYVAVIIVKEPPNLLWKPFAAIGPLQMLRFVSNIEGPQKRKVVFLAVPL